MARLHVLFDPNDKVMNNPEIEKALGIKSAVLTVPQEVRSVDIYNLAKKLAEMLLETL